LNVIVDSKNQLVYIMLQEVVIMTARQLIDMALAYAGISKAELARRMNMSPQLLNKRLDTGKFEVEEWEKIAKALGASAKISFVFPDGKEVGN